MDKYRSYLLSVLLVIFAFNLVDRVALGIVLQDIKVDLQLSDTQLGFLSGIAFALFYSLMGIPIARWADRGNRVTIISLTAAVWSLMVALCGMAMSFTQLLLIRVGVGVGEAGCVPPAHSLIADYFNRAERPRAAAVYALGTSLGVLLGYVLAGWLNKLYGWRVTFILLGSPGLLLAALAWLTLRDPRVRDSKLVAPSLAHAAVPGCDDAQLSLLNVCLTLWRGETFRHLLSAFSIIYFFAYGILQWQPTFFIRSYGLETSELGIWFALIFGIGGLIGTYFGGEWAARYAANNERLQLAAVAALYVILALVSAGVYLTRDRYIAFTLLAASAVGSGAVFGPLLATVQTLVPGRMRAMSIALLNLFANAIGMGLGPLAAGMLSDRLRPIFGAESLRYSLLILSPGYFWAAWHLWRASRTVGSDLIAMPAEREIAARPI